MKKPYQKPFFYIERFELLEHIASCTANTQITEVNYREPGVCTYKDANLVVFNQNQAGCNQEIYEELGSLEALIATMDPDDEGGCYNAFGDGNFFAS